MLLAIAGEASAARVLDIGSGAAVGSSATGVPAVAGAATGKAMGVTWAADRRIGAVATASAVAPAASDRARRRENSADGNGPGFMRTSSAVALARLRYLAACLDRALGRPR